MVNYRCIAPPVQNDPQLTTLLERCAVECLGRDKVLPVEQPSLGAEDFAELLRDVPGMMVRLGVAGPEGVRRCTTERCAGGRPGCWYCGSHGHRAGVDHGEHVDMNQRRAVIWVSLGAPLLILLALLATNQRQGKDRVQVLPAILVGSGLIISSASRSAAPPPGCWPIFNGRAPLAATHERDRSATP